MQEQQTHDREASVTSAHTVAAASAASANSRASGSSHSSASNRKPTGYTIPDPVSVEEHGRTFNGYREGKYLLPNDAAEQERLDLAHEMWRLLLFGDLSWAPFADEPSQVLDIGTGTGIWAIEFAQQHPASHVIGTDISLIQPPEGNIPSNCTFERDDVEEEWVFDRLFDYIHLRAMLTCFNDHVGVVQRIYNNLKPGGWVEYHDYDPEVFGKDEPNQRALLEAPIWEWSQLVFKGAARFGRDLMVARRYKKFLTDAGFVDVTEKIVLAPNKPWSDDLRERRIGQYMQANSLEMIDSVSAKLLHGDGMSSQQAEDLLSRCRECFQSKELHLYSRMYVVMGRKPTEDELALNSQPPKALSTKTEPLLKHQADYPQGKQPAFTDDNLPKTGHRTTVGAAEESLTGMSHHEKPHTTSTLAGDVVSHNVTLAAETMGAHTGPVKINLRETDVADDGTQPTGTVQQDMDAQHNTELAQSTTTLEEGAVPDTFSPHVEIQAIQSYTSTANGVVSPNPDAVKRESLGIQNTEGSKTSLTQGYEPVHEDGPDTLSTGIGNPLNSIPDKQDDFEDVVVIGRKISGLDVAGAPSA